MCPKEIYTKDFILTKIREFSIENGRPPRYNESGFENITYAAKTKFGSWTYALQIAGLQTYRSWHKKDTRGGRLCTLLNNNPMTLKEIRAEFKKDGLFKLSSNSETSLSLLQVIKNTKQITSIGPAEVRSIF